MEISRHVFLITGGASGLGAATARRFVERGAYVVLADVQREAGERLAAELGANARFVLTDVTDEASAQWACAAATDQFGSLHGLINCAGIAPAERVVGKQDPHRLALFAMVLQVNLVGTFNMIRLAAETMSRGAPDATGERGVIINTASVAAYDGQIGQSAYAASKGGIVAMTLPIARELSRHGIRVMTVAPGIMETPMLLAMPAEVQASLAASVPFPPRLGHGNDFAALVEHIVNNPYLNGEVIRLDGAIRMGMK